MTVAKTSGTSPSTRTEDKDERVGESQRRPSESSTSELEDSVVATDQSGQSGGAADSSSLDDVPNWPDENAETAFLSEQKNQGAMVNLPINVPPAPDEDAEELAISLPTLDELINRVPAQAREVLEELFRAKFVRVVRTKKRVLK